MAGTSADRYPVSAAATFVASGSTLTLTLVNTSPASKTIHPSQVLTSFYFDMLGVGAERVGLTCTSGSGVVVKVGAEGTEGEPAASVWTSTTDKEPPSGPDASAPLMLTLGDILVAGGVEGGAGLRRDEGSQTAPVRRRSLRRPERFGHARSGVS